MSEMDHDDDY
jgi:hypothetical protein